MKHYHCKECSGRKFKTVTWSSYSKRKAVKTYCKNCGSEDIISNR